MSSSTPDTKSVLFLGATGGVGLSALRRSLAVGHTCITLCRSPARLTEKLGLTTAPANLRIEAGNAPDVAAVARALAHPAAPGALVDAVVFSIGGAFSFATMSLDDPAVCATGMRTLLAALSAARADGPRAGRPRIVAVSTTGITTLARDVPLAFVPLYHAVLKGPHKDKREMEDLLVKSAEDWTLVRPSLLTDGPESPTKPTRAGLEDPVAATVETKAVGYTISREDVGKWIFENILAVTDPSNATWLAKAATLTY